MGVLTYINPAHGTASGTTYTTATPELPNGVAWTIDNDVNTVVDNNAPWNGATLLDFDEFWYQGMYRNTGVGSGDIAPGGGRILIEGIKAWSPEFQVGFFQIIGANFQIRAFDVDAATDYLRVRFMWDSGANDYSVDFADELATNFALEIIFDPNNATVNQRLRARKWEVGGTVPSFTNATATAGSGGTPGQPDNMSFSDPNNNAMRFKMRRFVISDDIAQDLSTYGLGAAGAPPLGARVGIPSAILIR